MKEKYINISNDELYLISKSTNESVEYYNFRKRLLNYIKPDYVHVLMDGKIVKSGGPELALKLEKEGYDWLKMK